MSGSPFKLLEPYSSKEKDIFFGRESEIFALYHLLKQTRLVLVYGASGTGKTSLIQAGLPKVFKISEWLRIPVRRKGNINTSLTETLNLINRNEESTDLPSTINTIYQQRWIPIYLVFDQFEEIFTLGKEEERVQFFATLQQIVVSPLPCKVILSMREEYIGHLYEYEYIVPKLFDKRFRVESMKDSTIKEVIQKMTAAHGIQLEHKEETADLILQQIKMGRQAAYLPYLQIYLHYLYEQAEQKGVQPIVFDTAGVASVGQLGDVLKEFIDRKIEEAQKYLEPFGATPNFAEHLLDEFATSEGTKQSQLKEALEKSLNASGDLIQKALWYFDTQAKILRADDSDVSRYEPVHDVVAKQIHELRSDEAKEYKTFERKLEMDYERWDRDNYAVARLLPELDLNKVAIFQDRLNGKEEYITKYKKFIESSRSHLIAVKRRKRWMTIFLWLLTFAAIVGGGLAYYNQLKADRALVALQRETKKKEEAQAAKILLEVSKIEDNASEIGEQYPNIARNMIQEALAKLKDYPNNIMLIEKSDSLKAQLVRY